MILNRQREVRVAAPGLESFLRRVKRELGLGTSDVTVCLITDAEMARMNEKFRRKKGSTDVLSFPTTPRRRAIRAQQKSRTAHSRRQKDLGDIAISPATARRYAKRHGRSLASELRALILHGVLHLMDFDHETDQGQMDKIEQRLRKRFGLI